MPRNVRVARAMSKRKLCNVSSKLKAFECAEKKTKKAAVRDMGMDNKRIREWCKQKEVLVSLHEEGLTPHNSLLSL